MRNFTRRDPVELLERSGTPNVGFGLLFKTQNSVPMEIKEFKGAVNGQIFEILVMDGNTVFKQGATLNTSTGKDVTARHGGLYRFLWHDGVAYMSQ